MMDKRTWDKFQENANGELDRYLAHERAVPQILFNINGDLLILRGQIAQLLQLVFHLFLLLIPVALFCAVALYDRFVAH